MQTVYHMSVSTALHFILKPIPDLFSYGNLKSEKTYFSAMDCSAQPHITTKVI